MFPFRKVQLIQASVDLGKATANAFPFRKVQLIHTNEPVDDYNHAVSIPQGTINTVREL